MVVFAGCAAGFSAGAVVDVGVGLVAEGAKENADLGAELARESAADWTEPPAPPNGLADGVLPDEGTAEAGFVPKLNALGAGAVGAA